MPGPLWVGVDDTDSPAGGCTTYALTEVLEAARQTGLDLIGEPRIVRLNPNVPFKTRGNAALSARVGHGRGPRRRQGVGPGGVLWSYSRGVAPTPEERRRFLDRAWEAVLRSTPRAETRTDPALVALDRPLPPDLYRAAVSRLVEVADVERQLQDRTAWVRTEGSRQGLVGAAASISWPGRRATWEAITYRAPERRGTPRALDAGSVRAVQERYPDLFLCFDRRTRRLLVAPHTSCPILYGIRSRTRAPLGRALASVDSEPVERWMIFRTNQGTGDHLTPRSIGELRPYDAARVRGTIGGEPARGVGGHVRWTLNGPRDSRLACMAFEPTKTLPVVAAQLRPGDRVELWGGRGEDPLFRVEGIRILGHGRGPTGGRPPVCERCHRRTESMGTLRGYRCRLCHLRYPPERFERVDPRRPPLGTYHPTPSARRHLAPLGPEP